MKTVTCIVALLITGFALTASAQAYPTKPVRIIAATPGTTGDLLARYLGQRLNERWGQAVVVENRPGAGATIAAALAARATPDGYTLHIAQLASHAAAVSLYKNLPYDPVRDFSPITLYAQVPLMFVTHPSVPASSLRDFFEYARQRPDQINYASAGVGTGSHLTTEMLKQAAGVRLVHVPYKGSSGAVTAILSGEAQVSSIALPTVLPQVKAGKARAHAVTSKQRFEGTPDVPTVRESGLPGFESVTWFGMMVPRGTPVDLVRRLNRDIVAILRDRATQAWMLARGAQLLPGTPEQFTAHIKSETVKWANVIAAAGINAR